MPPVFIVNPAAAGGRAHRAWRALERDALRLFPRADVLLTEGPGDATRYAADACAGGVPLVVAVGGDGTVHEVVNGLLAYGAEATNGLCLGIVGLGTGHDLVRTLALPSEPARQIVRLVDGADRRVDLGRITFTDGHQQRTRYFANIASFGLGGVTDRVMTQTKHPWLPAKLSFQLAVFHALLSYRNATVRVQADGGEWQTAVVKVAAVCNGRHFGGGMRIAPEAVLDDGMLDVVLIGDVSVPYLLRKLPTVYRGDHLALPDVRSFRARRVVAEPVGAQAEVLLDIDGEALGRLPATFEIVPGALTVRS